MVADLAAADLISADQLEILSQGWYRYDSLPDSNYWLDWVEASRPFFYGRLEFNPQQDLVDQFRRQGVYQFADDEVGEFSLDDSTDRLYEYRVEVSCQQLFEVWSDYSEAVGQPAGPDQVNSDRCDGPNITASTDRLYDYDLTVRLILTKPGLLLLVVNTRMSFYSPDTKPT